MTEGAMCTACDSESLYEAPIRTAPPLHAVEKEDTTTSA
jgi:hypothetical protein